MHCLVIRGVFWSQDARLMPTELVSNNSFMVCHYQHHCYQHESNINAVLVSL